MSPLARLHPTTEGRRGSRIDLEEGGCYLGIPRNRSGRAFTSVQGTGCGTILPGRISAHGQEFTPYFARTLLTPFAAPSHSKSFLATSGRKA